MPRRKAVDDGLPDGMRRLTSGRIQLRYYDDEGTRRSKTFARKDEAVRWAARTSADLQRGDYLDPRDARLTVEEVAELWLAARDRRPKTESTYRSLLKTHIYPRFRTTPVSRINALVIEQWVGDLSRSGLAAGTVSNAFRVLKGVLQAGVRAGAIRANPANGLGREILPKADVREMHFLTADEVKTLAAEFPAPYDLLIRFAAVTGMRAGEINALRWENVDLLRGRIRVCESISRVGQSVHIVKPKSGRTRMVPIPPETAEALRDWAARHPDFAPESYVWPGPFGGDPREPMNYSKHFYNRMFRPAVARALRPELHNLRFHDMRHTCAALLIAANLPPKVIQNHLGHASFNITMNTYGHLYSDAADSVTAAMSRAFG